MELDEGGALDRLSGEKTGPEAGKRVLLEAAECIAVGDGCGPPSSRR